MPLPRDFEPPEQCLPVYDAFRPYLNELGPCSEQVRPRLWRSGTEVRTWYVVRRGDVLIVVEGGSKVTPDIVTPRELAP